MFGSELVIQALARQGVRTIFSLSGNQIMPLYDACIDHGIRIVHVRHEAAAVFMADAWAQVTGEVGVAMLTAGPGVSNGIAPLYSALQSESPVLLISGDSPVGEDGNGSFQELDQVTMTRPLTKLSRRVMHVDALVSSIDEAIHTAMSPRRGPVHLALPFDVLTQKSSAPALASSKPAETAVPTDAAALQAVASLIGQAQRPVILAGPSACRGNARLAWKSLGEALQVPVIMMESPRGLRDPAGGAMAEQIAAADLVVIAGKRLDFTLGFGKGKVFGADTRLVVIDPDRAMLERAGRLLGERLVLECLGEPLDFFTQMMATGLKPVARQEWMQAVAHSLAVRDATNAPPVATGAIGSRQLCEQVQQYLGQADEPMLICDGGEFGQWAQAMCRAPLRLINGMSGAIGGGICYAIAAKIARPQATVLLLMGDGTSGFHFMEFDTAVRENAPFIAVIGNDLLWNAEHLIQKREYGEDRLIGCALSETSRYHDAAEALGGFGVLVREAAQIEGALRDAAASGRPACINVLIDSQPAPVYTRAATAAH